MKILPLLITLSLLALAIPAAAHGPPGPRDFETRVLTDQNDDCGGHGGSDNCRGSHDLLGLNVREAYLDGTQIIIFTFMLDGGEGSLTDTLTFQADGQDQEIALKTSDNQAFSANGAVRVEGPRPLLTSAGSQDGDRFYVDVHMKRSDLGVRVGDALSDFEIVAQSDGTDGDVMPGGYTTAVGVVDGTDTSTQTTRPSLTLKGPSQYATLNPEPSVQVPEGETVFVNLGISNKLNDMAQTLDFSRSTDAGVAVGFHDPGAAEKESYPATYETAIAKSAQQTVHLAVTGEDAGSTGTIQVVLLTDKGGRVTGTVDFEVLAADAEPDDSTPPDDDGADGGDGEVESPDEGAPAPGIALLLLGMLALAVRRR